MLKLLRALAIAIALAPSLVAGPAQAETQLALLERTFGALKQSATALEQGDPAKALGLLDSIRSSAETLRETAGRFAKQAAEAEKQREAEARGVAAKITETFQAEQAADKEVSALTAQIASLTVQLSAANTTRDMLATQAAIYRQEVQLRRECKDHFAEGIFWSGECWRLSFEDVFANRWRHLNNDIDGNMKQRDAIERARGDLNRQLAAQQGKVNAASARKLQLEDQRRMLDQQAKTLRAAVVSLSDASLFWTDTATLIASKITSIETLQQNLKILVGRANRNSAAPVFDSYEKEEVRSLEATLKDFARTLDNRTNILLRP